MNKKLLQAKMKIYGDTNATLATAVGCSPQRMSAKINAKDGAEFTQGQIGIMIKRYHLTNEEVHSIFFADYVS